MRGFGGGGGVEGGFAEARIGRRVRGRWERGRWEVWVGRGRARARGRAGAKAGMGCGMAGRVGRRRAVGGRGWCIDCMQLATCPRTELRPEKEARKGDCNVTVSPNVPSHLSDHNNIIIIIGQLRLPGCCSLGQ